MDSSSTSSSNPTPSEPKSGKSKDPFMNRYPYGMELKPVTFPSSSFMMPPEKVALMRESKRKKWAVNSTILPRERPLVYFVDPADLSKNLDLITNIKEGKYVLMHGARASGKSTRTWRVMEELQGSGYFCLYVTLTGVNFTGNTDEFWLSFGNAIKNTLCDFFGPGGSLGVNVAVPDIKTSLDFINICLRQNALWKLLASARGQHAGLVSLCGRAIQSVMEERSHDLKGRLSYGAWKMYSGEPLGMEGFGIPHV
ncbi:hypothetical protein BGX20_008483 [Mortierella sp. AD010]|nr:hypothetical protein BGX20_008483 [Mortierella sp. AD010]